MTGGTSSSVEEGDGDTIPLGSLVSLGHTEVALKYLPGDLETCVNV